MGKALFWSVPPDNSPWSSPTAGRCPVYRAYHVPCCLVEFAACFLQNFRFQRILKTWKSKQRASWMTDLKQPRLSPPKSHRSTFFMTWPMLLLYINDTLLKWPFGVKLYGQPLTQIRKALNFNSLLFFTSLKCLMIMEISEELTHP